MARRIRHSLTLAVEVWEALVSMASAEGRSVSNFIEHLVRAEQRRRERKEPADADPDNSDA